MIKSNNSELPQRFWDGHTIRIGTVELHALSHEDAQRALSELAHSEPASTVAFCEAHLCVRAAKDPKVNQALADSTLVLPDGVAMTGGARLIGKRFPARLPGPSIMLDFCKSDSNKDRTHFFLGGAPGVAGTLRDRLTEMIPHLRVAGTYSPPYHDLTDMEESEICGIINASRANVVWVGLGAPKQELWIKRNNSRLKAQLILAVGAAFDFHSGHRKWAPRWVRGLGLEWLYRMLTGGRRVFWRNLRNESIFLRLIIKQAIRTRVSRNCPGNHTQSPSSPETL